MHRSNSSGPGRERLAETVKDVRRSVDVIADDLFAAEDNARLAAEAAGRESLERSDESSPEDLAALLLAEEEAVPSTAAAEVETLGAVEVGEVVSEVITEDEVTEEVEVVEVAEVVVAGVPTPEPVGESGAEGAEGSPVQALFAKIRAASEEGVVEGSVEAGSVEAGAVEEQATGPVGEAPPEMEPGDPEPVSSGRSTKQDARRAGPASAAAPTEAGEGPAGQQQDEPGDAASRALRTSAITWPSGGTSSSRPSSRPSLVDSSAPSRTTRTSSSTPCARRGRGGRQACSQTSPNRPTPMPPRPFPFSKRLPRPA